MNWPTVKLDWDQFNDAAYCLANRIRERLNPKALAASVIAGIPRGGLPMAVQLSHALDVTLLPIDSVRLCVRKPFRPGRVIIVDDIVDTGKTLDYYAEQFKGLDPMFLAWAKRLELRMQTHELAWAWNAPVGTWLIFPWEDQKKAERDRDEFLRSRGLLA
jgi:hypoxanthine phosphoribosyltransferase